MYRITLPVLGFVLHLRVKARQQLPGPEITHITYLRTQDFHKQGFNHYVISG